MASNILAGIERPGNVYLNLSSPQLIEHALKREEGILAGSGALVTRTGKRTGRSPKDRFFVSHGESKEQIDWGPVNQPVEPDVFDALHDKVRAHLEGRDLFVIDGVRRSRPDPPDQAPRHLRVRLARSVLSAAVPLPPAR